MDRPANILLAAGLVGLAGLAFAGCVQVGGEEPLFRIESRPPLPPPVAANIPPGPAHEVCRAEMSRAMAQLADLQKRLDDCRRDRANDQRKADEKLAELKRQKEEMERERNAWKNRYEKLQDALKRD